MAPPIEPEFQQAVGEIRQSLEPLFKSNPEYEELFKVIQIPERVITWRVVWEDDKGKCQVNTGYRVQFNSTLGPYKGGLRFHPTVNLSVLKFLGFEQILKNALTGLPMGGGKGGSDFDPKGKSDNEIRKFCVAFMRELCRHIGPNTDVPAGDIGVSGREIGWMFGAYKRIRNEWTGVLTGKAFDWGGSRIRPEATGYGLVYYVQQMIAKVEAVPLEQTFKGKRVAVTGSGNVAQYAALKVIELGGTVVCLSDSKGAIVSTSSGPGLTPDEIHAIAKLKVDRKSLDEAKVSKSLKHLPGVRPWLECEYDVALPCATQNEISKEEAEHMVKKGVGYVAEGSNMGSTQGAIDVFESTRAAGKTKAFHGKAPLWYAPGKAANCGGVAVSGLEMAQNSMRLQWSNEEVDDKLHGIMAQCYHLCETVGEQYKGNSPLPSLVMGANIAGFLKVATAMKQTGEVW